MFHQYSKLLDIQLVVAVDIDRHPDAFDIRFAHSVLAALDQGIRLLLGEHPVAVRVELLEQRLVLIGRLSNVLTPPIWLKALDGA